MTKTLREQIVEARQAKAQLDELTVQAANLPSLEEQAYNQEIDHQIASRMNEALARITQELESQGMMLGHLKEQFSRITADVYEVVSEMTRTQNRIADCIHGLARVARDAVGAKSRGFLSTGDHAQDGRAAIEMGFQMGKEWEGLWEAAGGLSPNLLAFPAGSSENRLANDLMLLIVRHMGKQPYHPGHSDSANPFRKCNW